MAFVALPLRFPALTTEEKSGNWNFRRGIETKRK